MKHIVLGVSGSVAAYRAADLARELMRQGLIVRVCLTDSAQKFVTPALFEALTGQPCLLDTFEEPETGRMAHIDWARQAAAIVIAPATANTIARIAGGLGDDMLTTICLASAAPLVVALAMNPSMYAHEQTRDAVQRLKALGAEIVEPTEGDVACGESGQGKLASIAAIVDATLQVAHRGERLKGKKILITSGPTQEPIDSVRYLTNRSSGKMGAALARAALMMGADVSVVTGPSHEPMPIGANVVRVETAEEMLAAALGAAGGCDLIIGAAAVADYRPAQRDEGKMRRSEASVSLELVPNPDIIRTLAERAHRARVIAFAAEPDSGLDAVREKLKTKGVAAIAVNDISRADIGFDSSDNELTLVWADGRTESSGKKSKLGCALWLLEALSS